MKDTNDFLRKLQNLPKLPDDAILCTIDVVRLYPNILNDESLLCLKKALDKRRNKTVPTESLIELAQIVLKKYYFEFNDRFRKQKEGTAIETKFALPYAIIVMAPLEKESLEYLLKSPWLWCRYIDNIFMIWHHGENELKPFTDKFNKFHPTIKFTCDYCRERVHFLDVHVILENNKISTDLYIKERDGHQYLHSSLSQPCHCVKSIPYSQVLRLNRICLNNIFYYNHCSQLIKMVIRQKL